MNTYAESVGTILCCTRVSFQTLEIWPFEMRGHLTLINWSGVFKEEDPDKICINITTILQDAMEAFIPNKTINRKPGDKAWFNKKCRKVATKKR